MRGHRLVSHSMRLIACLIACACLAGCVYRIDVQQGNYVTQDLVAKLKPGMTKAEVRNLLGTPLLSDVFHRNRWDYYFSDVQGRKAHDRTLLTLLFDDEKLASFTGNANPAPPPPLHPQAPAPVVR